MWKALEMRVGATCQDADAFVYIVVEGPRNEGWSNKVTHRKQFLIGLWKALEMRVGATDGAIDSGTVRLLWKALEMRVGATSSGHDARRCPVVEGPRNEGWSNLIET